MDENRGVFLGRAVGLGLTAQAETCRPLRGAVEEKTWEVEIFQPWVVSPRPVGAI